MNNSSFAKLSREERWEARKRAMFSNENSLDAPQDPPQNLFQPKDPPEPQYIPPSKPEAVPQSYNYSSIPPPAYQPPPTNISPYNSNPNLANNFSPAQSIEHKRLVQQQENPRGRTPPSTNFFMNPVSEADGKRQKLLEEYKNYAQNDSGRRKDEVFARDDPAIRPKQFGEPPQYEEEKRRMYNLELKRQIEEKEASKRMNKAQDRVEEYFPFGKPGAGAPYRDQSGRIIAARPPRFNENDPNFNRPARIPPAPVRGGQEFYAGNPPGNVYNPPQNYSGNFQPPPQNVYYQSPPNPSYQQAPNPVYQPPNPSYQTPNPGYQPTNQGYQPTNAAYQPNPNYYSANPQQVNPYRQETEVFVQNNSLPHVEERFEKITDLRTDVDKFAEASKKAELQRALQEQIEEKKRQKDEEKRRKLMEERYEEERLARERIEMEEEFRREAEKKKKQISDLQSFNNGAQVLEPAKKGRRPRTPIDFPPPELHQPKPPSEEKRRGQSAINRSPIPQNPNEIPQEYINFLNSALDRKLNDFKTEHKVVEIKQQEEILRLRQREQMHSEHTVEAQREIERLKDELRRKQVEDEIRHRELTLALQTRPQMPTTKLPPYEPRPLNLPKGIEDASLSLDFAQKSLVSESKFIPLPNPTEIFPIKPMSPKEKKALHLDSIFPSLPENSNLDTFRSASSSIGVDNVLRKNEERLKALDRINPDSHDELNKLDQILFKFAESDKKEEMRKESKTRKDPSFEANNRKETSFEAPTRKDFFESGRRDNSYEVEGNKPNSMSGMYEYGRKIESPMLYNRGEFLPSIKELDAEATYSLPEANKGLYGVY